MAENNHQPTITPDHSRWSECWNHFEKKAGQKAACKYCQMQLSTKNGTTRLNRHYQETCPVRHPKPGRSGRQGSHGASAQAGIHSLQNASTFSRSSSDNSGQQTAAAAAEDQLIRMIALHGFPSSMVEDVQFIRFVQMLCPDFKMPSRDDVRKRCDELFDQEISSLKDALGRTPGLVSLSLGKAPTAWGEFVYLATHFIDEDWDFHCRVIQVFKALQDYEYYGYGDMLDIKGYHSECTAGHLYNYDKLKETISFWGLLPKFSGVLVDEFCISYFGEKLYDGNHQPHLSATQHKLICASRTSWKFADITLDWEMNTQSSGYPSGEDCFCAFQDENLKKKRREISSRLHLDHPWTFARQWYAYYCALEIIHEEVSSGPAQISSLAGKVIFHDTQFTELFRTTLGAIYRAIKTISVSSSPTSNLCLIELLKLRKVFVSKYDNASRGNEELSSGSEDGDVSAFVDATVLALNCVLKNSCSLLSIPLVLDPRFKLAYVQSFLKNASLDAGIICMVGEGFRQLFIEYNNQGHETEQGNQSNGMDQTNHVNEMDVDTSQQEHGSTWQLIDQSGMDQNNTISHESLTELDAYLQDETVPVEQEDFDILKWWEENCNRYPTLARMARDFLAIPVASKPSPQLMTEITNHLRRYA